MNKNDYALAAAKAKEAFAFRPNDPAATQLANRVQEPIHLENALTCFDQGDYEAVVKLCNAYPRNYSFTLLSNSN